MMYKRIAGVTMLAYGLCFGAAEDVVKKFVGVGCKTGTVVTVHSEPCSGWYTCAYAYTPEAHITKAQLQEIATGIVAARPGKKPRSALLDPFEPTKRTFSLGKQMTPLSVGLYQLHNKEYRAEHASWQDICLLEGEPLGIFGEASWSTKGSLKPEENLIIERIIHMIIGTTIEVAAPEHVSLDDAATKIAATESKIQDKDLVVVMDAKAWKEQNKRRARSERAL